MWAGLVRNTKEEMTGKDIDHHFSDCQQGVKGDLGMSRNKKSGWRDKGTRDCRGHIVLAIAFWNSDQMKELCGIHVKRGCIT